MKLREFGNYKEFKSGDVKEFRAFINQCWNNRYVLYDESTSKEYSDYEGEEYSKEQRFLTFDGNLIKARNYVGFINYNGEKITIYPKIFPKKIKNEDIDKYLLTNLLFWLKNSTKIKLPLVDFNFDISDNDSLLEILMFIFSKYTREIVYNKPYNHYEEIEDELTFLKGKLNSREYIKRNIYTGRWNYFNTIYEPFQYNNKLNQIIKYVSKLLVNVTKNNETAYNLRRILFILDEVDDVVCNRYSCNEVRLSKLNKDYELVLNLCKLLLSNGSLSTGENRNEFNFCFLVPMELIFEEFIFNFIKKNYEYTFKDVISQKSNLYLADLYINNEKEKKAFNLKQDIYIRNKDDKKFILDTKYKNLVNDKSQKYGISQSDMYQMSSYALRGGYTNLALVYPKTMFLDDIQYRIKSGFGREEIFIKIILVDFLLNQEMLKDGVALNKVIEELEGKLLDTFNQYFIN